MPQNWEGVRVKPLHIDFMEGMSSLMKPRARPVNPKLFEHAHKEFLRLLTYMYVRYDGPVACTMVIAPKAIAPFIYSLLWGLYTYQQVHTASTYPDEKSTADSSGRACPSYHDSYGDADIIDEETSF